MKRSLGLIVAAVVVLLLVGVGYSSYKASDNGYGPNLELSTPLPDKPAVSDPFSATKIADFNNDLEELQQSSKVAEPPRLGPPTQLPGPTPTIYYAGSVPAGDGYLMQHGSRISHTPYGFSTTWASTNNNTDSYVLVKAGVYDQEEKTGTGVIVIQEKNVENGRRTSVYDLATGSGLARIISADGDILSISTDSGKEYRFDVTSRTLTEVR